MNRTREEMAIDIGLAVLDIPADTPEDVMKQKIQENIGLDGWVQLINLIFQWVSQILQQCFDNRPSISRTRFIRRMRSVSRGQDRLGTWFMRRRLNRDLRGTRFVSKEDDIMRETAKMIVEADDEELEFMLDEEVQEADLF
jgi:hypothetical protein